MTEEELKKRYSQLPDEELTRIALKDSKDLRPEALAIMKAELVRRNLMQGASSGIAAQMKELSNEELLAYCNIVQSQPCPICDKTSKKLNGILTGEITNLLFISFYETRFTIACSTCLEEKMEKVKSKNMLFGWWGIGFFRSINAYRLNKKMTEYIGQEIPSPLLKEFLAKNVGKIETYKNDTEQLQFILRMREYSI